MRNRLLTWGLLAVLAAMSLALGGCGSHAASGSKSTALFDPTVVRADTPEAIDAELAARFEKTKKAADKMFAEEEGHLVITHKYGKTILPEQPQRIAVIGLEDTAVSLDIPIAAAHLTKSSYLYPLMKDKGIANIPINAETKTINLEAVQQAKPDLILMRDSYDKNAYNALSKIAPVVALDKTKNNLAISMESLPDLQADYLVISSGYGASSAGSKEAAAKRYEELRKDPLWQTLPAVQDGHMLDVDSIIWNAHGLIAKEMAIQDLVDWLGSDHHANQ